MRRALTLIALLPFLGILTAGKGCVLNGETEAVIKRTVCVWFDENRDSPEFVSQVVCDQFVEKIERLMKRHHLKPEDILEVNVVSGSYKTANLPDGQDWTISAAATIHRQDDPEGPITEGPEELLSFREQSLRAARRTVRVGLTEGGVEIIENAIMDQFNGDTPRLLVTLINGSVEPEPTPEDPLVFSHRLCVRLQVVVAVDMDDDSESEDSDS